MVRNEEGCRDILNPVSSWLGYGLLEKSELPEIALHADGPCWSSEGMKAFASLQRSAA